VNDLFIGRAINSILFISLLFLAGCSLSIEDATEKTVSTVEKSFVDKEMEASEESEAFSYYLPIQFSIETETENNIVFTNKKQTYVLFVNPYEPYDSEVVYDSTKSNYENLELDHTMTEDGKLGYILISQVEEEEEEFYEVTVGVGGVKMTTVADTQNMEASAKTMMEIVSSVKVK
jgi:hypothetical protein